MKQTLVIKVDLVENYSYADLEQILENCSIIDREIFERMFYYDEIYQISACSFYIIYCGCDYSDFGCWENEWQENVFEQIIASINYHKKKGEHPDTFTLLTKNPEGIDLGFIPDGKDLREVCLGVTVDRNANTARIAKFTERLKHFKPSVLIAYQPLLEHIEPTNLKELADAFGAQNCYVLIGGELAEDNSPKPTPFEWMKDIIDKCIELGIPYGLHFTLKNIVEAAGYEFKPQKSSAERYDEAITAEKRSMIA